MNPEDDSYIMEVNGSEVYVENGEVSYEVTKPDYHEQEAINKDREEFLEAITKVEDEK
ncbi:hypothetical protein [Lacticaseibacillus paracasei]|uniref:hypothetical protein n=1 Tax=Lacticaseibacillus paracasei TaxID=1597 RepID=UPI002A5992C7|nr:hypothetical protein [Lacticaseibacillus paracasei]MDY0837398.1 hypothetical protein [Lacticaseibacillus paracasei]